MNAVKNQIRGLRRTFEMYSQHSSSSGNGAKNGSNINSNYNSNGLNQSLHMALVGNPGSGKSSMARVLAEVLYEMGVVKSRKYVTVGREDLIDKKSEARTVFKVRRVLEQAQDGVLCLEEAYTLLPSTARPRGRDHGAAALRELARALPQTGVNNHNPLVLMTGSPMDLQRILSSDIGFKGHFLTRIEFPDSTPESIARIFMSKINEKGLVAAEGVTVEYLAELIGTNTDPEWRQERNGRIADLLLVGVRAELRKRVHWDDSTSKGSLSPMKILSPGTSRMPAFSPNEVFVTVEDVQNAIVNGM